MYMSKTQILEGIDEDTAILTRDKYKMKQRFHEGGIKTAEVSLLQEKEDGKKVRALSYNYASSSPEARGSSC